MRHIEKCQCVFGGMQLYFDMGQSRAEHQMAEKTGWEVENQGCALHCGRSSGLFVRVGGSNQYSVKSLRSRGMEALPHGLRLFVFNIHLYSFVCVENEYMLCKLRLCVTILNPHETVKFALVLRPCFMQRDERSSEKRGQTGFNMLKGRQAQKRPPS